MPKLRLLIAAVLCLALSACRAPAQPQATDQPPAPDQYSLAIVNIGKADCIVLRFGAESYLVDTGRAEDYPRIVRALRHMQVETLNGIVITHGHKDHIGGMAALATLFRAQTIYYSALDTVTMDKGYMATAARQSGAQLQTLAVGDTITLPGGELEVLGPGAVYSEENANSLMLRLTGGPVSALLMGDALLENEQALLGQATALHADILKAGHHGRTDASGAAFAAEVAPRYVYITGDPLEDDRTAHPLIIARYEQLNARVDISQGDFLYADYRWSEDVIAPDKPNPAAPPAPQGVAITAIDHKAESVVIANNGGQDIDLGGWSLWAKQEGAAFVFPPGSVLPAQDSITVASGKNPPSGDYTWLATGIWKKDDTATLVDANGAVAAAFTR